MLDDPLNIPLLSGAVKRGRNSLASDNLARRARFVGRHGDGCRSRLGLEQRDAAHDRAGALRSRVRTNRPPPRIADRLTWRAAGAKRRSSAGSALRTGCRCHRHHRPSVHRILGRTCGDRGQSPGGAGRRRRCALTTRRFEAGAESRSTREGSAARRWRSDRGTRLGPRSRPPARWCTRSRLAGLDVSWVSVAAGGGFACVWFVFEVAAVGHFLDE